MDINILVDSVITFIIIMAKHILIEDNSIEIVVDLIVKTYLYKFIYINDVVLYISIVMKKEKKYNLYAFSMIKILGKYLYLFISTNLC